ncbi:type II secretion system minor pseudopilin GspK [Litorimonas sp. WD9-15]|uniref:type II secretion system minor pseudopilin GspK n=1 Tax=Litorimonas sp. WD9-15 TaxID=3418716 RepID=UPI003CFD23AE
MRKSDTERGTVLLTTLLIMSVMAAITVALMDDIRIAVKRTINVNAYAQADWQGRGAEDFIRAWLTNDFAALDDRAKSLLIRQDEPIILPTEDGVITVHLKDASHCFNLNAVLDFEGKVTEHPAEFKTLSENIGIPQNQAEVISSALMDWIDADQNQRAGGAEDGTYLRANPPYRTSDTKLTAPEEMRALNGMDEDLWDIYQPFVCTGRMGEMPAVNLNTLELERIAILAAAIGGDNASTAAQRILEARPDQGFGNREELGQSLASLELEGVSLTDRLTTDVSAVFVEVVTTVGPAERVRTYRYDGVDKDAPVLTYRGWGRETFRPEIEDPNAQEDAR